MMPEVIEVKFESAALFSANDVAESLDELGTTIGRQPHHLSLIAVVGKSEKLRGGGVDDSGRMRGFHLVDQIDRVPFSHTPHSRNEIDKTVDRQERSLFKWRNKERARQVRAMVFDVMKLCANRCERHVQ